ncbi:hypothetical protein VI06_20940 [Aquitalea magnusonii]|nr:hypothetical protein VI06_20940 [Aquitalea magnusonii]
MPTFQEVGFLSDELSQFKENVRGAYPAPFHIADLANNIAMRMLWEMPQVQLDEAKAYFVAAFARALQSFQALILMAERGAEAETRTLLRSLAETVFLAAGMIKVPNMVARFEEDNARHRKAVANRMIELNRAKNPEADVRRFEQELAAISAEFPHGPRGISWSSLAAEVGLVPLYESAYRFTSGDAAHATLLALNRHMAGDEQGDLHQFVFEPSAANLSKTFLSAVIGMVSIMGISAESMGQQDFNLEVSNLLLEIRLHDEHF